MKVTANFYSGCMVIWQGLICWRSKLLTFFLYGIYLHKKSHTAAEQAPRIIFQH